MPSGPIRTGSTDSAAVSLPKCAATPSLSAAIPPTASTEYTASTMTAVIMMMNWKKSVHSTAHSPAATAYMTVMTKQIPTATSGSTFSAIDRIVIIAFVTQPRMIRLIGIAR